MAEQYEFRSRIPQQKPLKPKITKWQRFYRTSKRLAFSLLAILTILFSSLILINYHRSLDWSKNKNSLKMAEMSPDMLQDSPKQIAIKEDFLKLANAMMKPDGSIAVTNSKLVALKNDLDQIKTAKPQYQSQYQKIADKYAIELALKSLFNGNKVVTADLDHVHKTLTVIGPTLNGIHQKNPHDRFVSEQMTIIHHLNHDLKLIKVVASNTANLVVIKQKTATFKPDIIYADYQKAIDPQDNLVYQWKVLQPFLKLEPEIKEVLNKQEHKIDLYNSYKEDMHKKEQAYEDLRKARLAHADNNAQVVEQIRQQKLEKEREKQEEAEAKRKAEQEQKQAEKDNKSNDSSSDSNSNQDKDQNKNKDKQSNSNKDTDKSTTTNKNKDKPKDHYIDPDQDSKSDQTSDEQVGN